MHQISETDGMCNSLLNNYVLCLILAPIIFLFPDDINHVKLLLRLLIIMFSYLNEQETRHGVHKCDVCDKTFHDK